MNDTLRSVVGLYTLLQRINRRFWLMAIFLGFLLPLVIQAALSPWLDTAGRTNLLVANLMIGLAMLTFRKAGIVMVGDRLFGCRDLLATAGVTSNSYLIAYALDAMTLALLPIGLVFVAVAEMGVAAPSSWTWLVPYVLTTVMLFAAGALIAGWVRSLPPAILAVDMGMMASIAFCPLAYPAERVPSFMRPVVSLLPPTLSAETIKAAWSGRSLFGWEILLLTAWTAIFVICAWRRFQWTDVA